MTSRKMSFFEFWRSKKERGALLERTNQLRLLPSQLKRLLGDSGVRAALQNVRAASLLPPVGTEVFRRFTPASLEEIKRRQEAEEKERENRKNKEVEEKESPKPARDLEAEKPLPFIYSGPPPELLNTPLEELDPFYQSQKTFIVLGKGNVLHRFNAEPSCYLLSPFSPLRTVAINILIHSLLMLVTILTNCVFMTMSNPPAWTQYVEYVFIAIFTSEAVIKVASRGFCVGKFTFLRDPWNWLDVMVVFTGYLSVFVDFKKFLVLVTVPRVLKLIALSQGLKTAVRDLVQSVKRLVGVFILAAFCLSILALIGLELYMGSMKNKCVLFPINTTVDFSSTPDYYDNAAGSSDFNFTQHILNETNWYFVPGHMDALLCGNSSQAGSCPEGFTCLRAGKTPNYGLTSFNSFGWSLLSVSRLMMQDFWENLVLLVLRAEGTGQFYIFMVVIFPVCFCIISLIVAVVAMASREREEAAITEAKQKEEEFSQILEVLRRSEEEEQQAGSRAALSEKQVAENKNDEQKHTMEEVGKDPRSCPPCWFICADFLLKWNCCGCWRWLKQRLYTFMMNPFFDLGIQVCLIVNALFMAMEHYPMTEQFESMLAIAHLVFTAIFTAEMVVKVVAMDPYNYFQVGWNIFDSIIVMFSLLELGLADVEGLSVMRCFRLLRILRLARWWPEFHLLMKITWASMRALRHLTLLLLIMVFVFTVVGMQLFRTDYNECVCRISFDCELPRWHMADFFHALLIVLRVLYGEWIETLWDCMEVSGQATCLIFFMMVVVIGNLLVLNLFVTLLLGSFCCDVLPALEQRNKEMSRIKTWFLEHVCSCLGKKNHVKQTAVDSGDGNRKEYLALNFVPSDQPGSEVKALSGNQGNLRAPIASAEIEIESKTPQEKEEKKHDDNVQKQAEVQQDEDEDDDKGHTPEDCCCDKCYRCCPFLDIDTSQGTGRVWSNFRRACLAIVQHRCFEIFIIVIIVLSSAALVFEDIHLQHRPILKAVVETADQVFTYLFLLEMLLKWIAFGLKRYFSDAWCWLDFLILDVFLISLVASMLGFSGLGAIQFLRTLRALGPLRALSRFEGMRLVVQSLVRTVPSLISCLLVCLTVSLIFSIMGVNLFAGKFSYCFNETSEELFQVDAVGNKSECLELQQFFQEITWKTFVFNYDNVANGYLSLLQLAASESWADLIYAAVDSTQVESQPEYEANLYMFLYFIFFFIIGCFFPLVFLIRVFIDNLQRDKICQFGGKYFFMTEQQHRCSMSLKRLFPKKPQKRVPRPQNCCQARLFDLVTSPYYEVVMVAVICLNMVVQMLPTQDDSHEKEEVLYFINFTFILIFLIEFILKIIALRKHYFKDGWNIVDFVVLIISIVGMFLADLVEKYFFSPAGFALLRLGRVGRVLYFIRWTRGIRKLLLALMRSLPAVFNIGLVLFLLMFAWSVFGMWNFPYLKKTAMIDDVLNFETFWSSLICVYSISTSSDWGGLLRVTMITPPHCDPYLENPGSTVIGDCGKPAIGIVFFTTYIVLSSLLVLHMYIVVLLEVFNSEDAETLSDDELQMFYKTWTKFDPDASQFIHYSQLSEFCDALRDPLRIPKPNTVKLIHMDLPLFPGDKVHCVDVLLTLATQVLDASAELDTLKARMEEKFKANSTTVLDEPISSTLRRKKEEVAATLIQRAYRRRLLQHRDGKETAVQAVNGGDVSGSAHQGGASQ